MRDILCSIVWGLHAGAKITTLLSSVLLSALPSQVQSPRRSMPRFWMGCSSTHLTWAKQPSPSSVNCAGEMSIVTWLQIYTLSMHCLIKHSCCRVHSELMQMLHAYLVYKIEINNLIWNVIWKMIGVFEFHTHFTFSICCARAWIIEHLYRAMLFFFCSNASLLKSCSWCRNKRLSCVVTLTAECVMFWFAGHGQVRG